MLEIFRKSTNTNNFGQHQYYVADHTQRQVVTLTATTPRAIGDRVRSFAELGEYFITARGSVWTPIEWEHQLRTRVYPALHPSEYKTPYLRRKQRMNPHRRALLDALELHGGGYRIDSHTSGALEYDVSVCGEEFGQYIARLKKEAGTEYLQQLAQYLPDSDPWWADTEQEWDANYDRFGFICEQMSESVVIYDHRTGTHTPGYALEGHSINPATGKLHNVEVQFAGRGGKHLVVTAFDGKPTPCDLADEIACGDRTAYSKYTAPRPPCKSEDVSAGYTNQWMRDFASMINYWQSANIPKQARNEFRYQEQAWLERIIEDEVVTRAAEAARLSAVDAWFYCLPLIKREA